MGPYCCKPSCVSNYLKEWRAGDEHEERADSWNKCARPIIHRTCWWSLIRPSVKRWIHKSAHPEGSGIYGTSSWMPPIYMCVHIYMPFCNFERNFGKHLPAGPVLLGEPCNELPCHPSTKPNHDPKIQVKKGSFRLFENQPNTHKF
jgi:hypothetical protein